LRCCASNGFSALALARWEPAELERARREHRVAREYLLAVEKDLCHRRHAVELERERLPGLRLVGTKPGAKPPVLGVEVVLLTRPPTPRVA
jgi:hypothetical protein